MSLFKSKKQIKVSTTEAERAKPATSTQSKKGSHGTSAHIRHAHMSEKALGMGGSNKYVFVIDNHANKRDVQREVEERYGVVVSAVNMIRKQGKHITWRGSRSQKPELKKAIVTLKSGHKIEIA